MLLTLNAMLEGSCSSGGLRQALLALFSGKESMTGGRLVSRLEVKYLPNLIGALQAPATDSLNHKASVQGGSTRALRWLACNRGVRQSCRWTMSVGVFQRANGVAHTRVCARAGLAATIRNWVSHVPLQPPTSVFGMW